MQGPIGKAIERAERIEEKLDRVELMVLPLKAQLIDLAEQIEEIKSSLKKDE